MMIAGDHVFTEDTRFDGMISGDAWVRRGVVLSLKGMVGGNVIVEDGATLRLSGMVGGRIDCRGGRVIRET